MTIQCPSWRKRAIKCTCLRVHSHLNYNDNIYVVTRMDIVRIVEHVYRDAPFAYHRVGPDGPYV